MGAAAAKVTAVATALIQGTKRNLNLTSSGTLC
jgi:hypothetical protein